MTVLVTVTWNVTVTVTVSVTVPVHLSDCTSHHFELLGVELMRRVALDREFDSLHSLAEGVHVILQRCPHQLVIFFGGDLGCIKKVSEIKCSNVT
jgi:hypothetical protein